MLLRLALLGAACLALPACFGPYYEPPELTLPTVRREAPVERLVVDEFVSVFGFPWSKVSRRQLDSTTVEVTTTSGHHRSEKDVSAELVALLRAEGVDAVLSGPDVVLGPDDVVLRGGIDSSDGWDPMFVKIGDYVQIGLSFATLGMYGLFTPYVYPVAIGARVQIGIELDDAEGNSLLRHEEVVKAYNESFHLLGWSIDDTLREMVTARSFVAKAVARAVQQR